LEQLDAAAAKEFMYGQEVEQEAQEVEEGEM